jgi:tRNA nucleotidyltransferase/poly(A) polymerase
MPNVVDFQISLNLIPKEEIDNLKFISKTLKESGEECFLVGGSVRDLVLGKVPHEYDLTTSALPETIKSKFKRVFDTGILHGTVTIVLEKSSYEITTYRSEF